MKYCCELCNFKTEDSGAWCRHKKAQYHIHNIEILCQDFNSPPIISDNGVTTIKDPRKRGKIDTEIKYKRRGKTTKKQNTEFGCEHCDKRFSTLFNLQRHGRTCKAKQKDDLIHHIQTEHKNRELELMKQVIDEKDKMMKQVLDEKEKALIKRDKDFEYMKRMVESAGILANKSLSALNYSNVYYKDAPKLIPLDKSIKIMKEEDDDFVERLIYKYGNKTLARFIGTHIVYHYRKSNPVDQSMWTSDVVRLNYIIKETSKWVVDKNGIKVRDNIIKPILDNILGVIKAYEDRWYAFVTKNPDEIDECVKANMRRATVGKIMEDINQGTLADEINKYIAPYFQMRREDDPDDDCLPLESDSEPDLELIKNRIEKKFIQQAKQYKVPVKKQKKT